jgi:predicted Zn finger-like uncharacterized protein
MRFVCDSCRAQYMISDEKVGAKGVKVRCKKCGFVILVRKTQQAAPPPAPVDDGVDSTQVMQNPLANGGDASLGQDPESTSPGIAAAGESADAPAAPKAANKVSGNGLFAGVEEDEIGAVFDQVLNSGSHPVVAPSSAQDGEGGGLGLGDDSDDDRMSTRVIDAETVRKLAEEAAQDGTSAGAKANGAASSGGKNGKNGKAAPEPEKHDWFVAIHEKQVGPLALDKVKAHWDQGEIGPDSLCWRAGFSDWLPLSEVAELASVLAPQPKKPVIVGSGDEPAMGPVVSVPVESAFSAGGVTRTVRSEVAVMTGAPAAEPDPSGWKPSAASALASLVQEEIEALARPPVAEAPRAPAPAAEPEPKSQESDDGLKGLLDLPSTEHRIPEPAPSRPSAAAARTREPAPAPREPEPTSYPAQYRPQSTGIPRQLMVVGGIVLALLVVLVVAVVALAFGNRGNTEQVVHQTQPSAPAQLAQAPVAAPAPPPPVAEPKAEAPRVEAPKQEDPPPAPKAEPEPKRAEPAVAKREDPPAPKASRASASSAPAPAPRDDPPARSAPPAPIVSPADLSDDFDKEFGGGSSSKKAEPKGSTAPSKKNDSVYIPPAPGSATGPEKLAQSDVYSVVLQNKGALQQCVKEQKEKDPGTSGKVVMRWVIKTNGTTSNVSVQTAEFRSTHVATCIGSVIKGMRFPAHKVQGDPIDFPFNF